MAFKTFASLWLLCLVSNALPSASSIAERQASNLPLLNLGYATYSPSVYNSDADIYTYTNIRYAAPPVGNLRWRKPQPPLNQAGVQNGSVGFSCLQPGPTPSPQSEDCLFLDLYVPGKAARNPSQFNLPVAVWVHGGNNLNGAKDQKGNIFFNGTGPVITSNNSMIIIATNYRLGPWGFLSGNTMELQGLPNAGLHDQRAVFQWVQNHISQIGGDKTKVNAWGESAGASDLLHLLVAEGGTLDPLFHQAFLQSPASQTEVDRLGMLESCFQTFSSLANCTGTVDCLRGQSSATLQAAANQLAATRRQCGNVASDGTFIRQALSLEFASKNYWKSLDSAIVTHVSNESVVFAPTNITDDASFRSFVAASYPAYANTDGIVDAVVQFYPSPNANTTYKTQFDRVLDYIRDSTITIRVAAVVLGYLGKSWAGEYSVPPGFHATDLIPLWWNKYLHDTTEPGPMGRQYPVPDNILALSATYQSYAVSHAMTGDPNTNANFNAASYPAIHWPMPTANSNNQELNNVLNFTSTGVQLVTDNEVLANPLLFQLQAQAAQTNQGGYAVPGTVFDSGSRFPPLPNNPSANYTNQCSECRE